MNLTKISLLSALISTQVFAASAPVKSEEKAKEEKKLEGNNPEVSSSDPQASHQ